ncbi:unnamed protein product [Oikopleura dioica]|uniref:Uncharacterized protein n=1 Tax=Oikopleura dioica TaxID=34765 RepID=E4YKH8_OIKDI|nr:unnamed protein product [Oikopleura dioica]
MDQPGWTLTAPGPSPAPGSIARQESVIEEMVMSMAEAYKSAQQGKVPSSPATSTPPAPSPENQQYHPLAAANLHQQAAPGYLPTPYQPQPQPQMTPPTYPPQQHYATSPPTQYPYQYGAPQYGDPQYGVHPQIPPQQPYPTPALPQNPLQPYPPQPSYQAAPQHPQQSQYQQYPPRGYAPAPAYPQAPPAGYGYSQPAAPYGYPIQQQR